MDHAPFASAALAQVLGFAVRGSLVLAAAFVLAWMLRRRSASLRHAVWVGALLATIGNLLKSRYVASPSPPPALPESSALPFTSLLLQDVPDDLLEEQRPFGLFRCTDQFGNVRINEIGADAVGDEIRMNQHRLDERRVGGNALDAEFA